jgi:hydrogenase maturation protease
MKIIGCGNPDRGDDAAGVLVSERLRELGIQAETHIGDPLALLERWCCDDDVILVDAVVTGASAGSVRVWDLPLAHIPHSTVSSHGFDIGQAVGLARILRRLPARLRVYGIEGQRFDVGTDPSPEVRQAIEAVVHEIVAEGFSRRPATPAASVDQAMSDLLETAGDRNR